MGLSDFKITDADITSKGVQASPDQLSGTAEDNKKVFDRLTSGPVRDGHNKLIDALVALGVEQLIQYGSEDIKYIRLNADEHIEVSSDGVTWTEVASSGHLIYDAAGKQMPQRSRLKFGGASVVTDDGTYTIVSGVKGDKGETGAKGDKGDTGDQGPRGAAWYPAVDGLGNLTFVLSETATPPPAYNIRGPRAPRAYRDCRAPRAPPAHRASRAPAVCRAPRARRAPPAPQVPPALPVLPARRAHRAYRAPRARQARRARPVPPALQAPPARRDRRVIPARTASPSPFRTFTRRWRR